MHNNDNNVNLELRSEDVQEILTHVPPWIIRWGTIVIFIIFLIIISFTWIIKYPDIITAEVTITTVLPPEKLIAKNSGKLTKLFVKNMEEVTKGKAIAIIENPASYQDVFKLKNIIDTLKVGSEFYFPFHELEGLQLGLVESDFILFEKDYTAYQLNKRLHPHFVESSFKQIDVNKLKERIVILLQQKEIEEKQLNIKEKELERYKKLYESGVISKNEWEMKNLDYMQYEKNIHTLNSSLVQLSSSLNDLGNDITTTKINETKDEVNLFKNVIQSYNKLKKSIADWELAYVLRSSIDGRITFLKVWNENQVVEAGDNVFTVVPPLNSNFIAKVKAESQNSGKIEVGQSVNIYLDNYPVEEFGSITGKVKAISLVPDQDEYILLDVSLQNKLITSYNKEIIFRQEMKGSADVVTKDVRLMERFIYKLRNISKREKDLPKKSEREDKEYSSLNNSKGR